ncbi:MAG: T9SS type A sorting domain-containing protein [Taibaiella sp.]|nr:T9SS type A sorting domain-containing protein [Taibaiella sp.]
MKNLYLAFVLICLCFNAQAQKIYFTDTANRWIVVASDWGWTAIIGYTFGDTITQGSTQYQLLRSNKGDSVLVRTDSSRQKVYAKVYKGSIQGAGQIFLDSNEHLLYDFTLKLGDTFAYKTFRHYVTKIDSVQIDGTWHKVFNFTDTGSQGWAPYTVIEGIGHMRGLLYPFGPVDFEGELKLSCFYRNQVKPVLNKKINHFDNDMSCYLNIEAEKSNNDYIRLYPQPATSVVNIQLPATIKNGTILILDQLGRAVYHDKVQNISTIKVGKPATPGLYYYRVTDNTTGQAWQGKILFE